MDSERAAQIADQVSGVAAASGLGFLLARVTVDAILEGLLDPDGAEFGADLSARAHELLLRAAGSADASTESIPYAALSEALALAPDPGIPVGEEWQAIARALDDASPADVEAQLEALEHFRRFVIEDRHEGAVVYRWFHPGLRDALRARVGGLASESGQRALSALIELRNRRTDDGGHPERAGWFLLESLPAMAAASNDDELMRAVIDDAPEAVALGLVASLTEAAEEKRALGDSEAARKLNQRALLVCGPAQGGAYALALIGQAESLTLGFDMWREGRDMSWSALKITEELLEREPERYDLLEISVRAARMLARALGIGAFDAHDGLYHMEDALRRASGAAPEAQPGLAPAVADLLQSYAESLGQVTPAEVRADTAAAAGRIRAQLVDAGREDMRLPLAESLGFSQGAREELGDEGGIEAFHESLAPILAVVPTPARWILPLVWMITQLSRALAFRGAREDVRELLDRTVEGFAPTAERADDSALHRLGFALMLGYRAAALAAEGRGGEALDDASRGFGLTTAHGGSDPAIGLIVDSLTMRLIEIGRPEEALRGFDQSNLHPSILRELARGEVAARLGAQAEAVDALQGVLDAFDPGEVVPRAPAGASEFIAFGQELRAGRALAEMHRSAEEHEAAEGALRKAATAFVRRRGAGSPGCLAHLEPALLTDLLPALSEAAGSEPGIVSRAAWLDAIATLGEGVWPPPEPQPLASIGHREAIPAIGDFLLVGDANAEAALEIEEPFWPVREVAAIEAKLSRGLNLVREETMER